jgi:hypothetical protein
MRSTSRSAVHLHRSSALFCKLGVTPILGEPVVKLLLTVELELQRAVEPFDDAGSAWQRLRLEWL